MRHYYRNLGASEVTTSWRYTNLFIIITINGLLLRINITQMWYKKTNCMSGPCPGMTVVNIYSTTQHAASCCHYYHNLLVFGINTTHMKKNKLCKWAYLHRWQHEKCWLLVGPASPVEGWYQLRPLPAAWTEYTSRTQRGCLLHSSSADREDHMPRVDWWNVSLPVSSPAAYAASREPIRYEYTACAQQLMGSQLSSLQRTWLPESTNTKRRFKALLAIAAAHKWYWWIQQRPTTTV